MILVVGILMAVPLYSMTDIVLQYCLMMEQKKRFEDDFNAT